MVIETTKGIPTQLFRNLAGEAYRDAHERMEGSRFSKCIKISILRVMRIKLLKDCREFEDSLLVMVDEITEIMGG